jgi:hypothetical protein
MLKHQKMLHGSLRVFLLMNGGRHGLGYDAMPPNAVNLMYFRGLKPIYVDEKRAFLGEDTGGTPVLQKKVHGVACHPEVHFEHRRQNRSF